MPFIVRRLGTRACSWPAAQSCCCIPEWNPAVVQQIGRVDRVGSRWEQLVAAADAQVWREAPPRIEILPIVFKGTYD